MIDGLLVLIPLSVAAVLACFRFIGCRLSTVGLPAPPDPYGEAIKKDAIAHWRLGEKTMAMPAKDQIDGHDGTYQITSLMADLTDPSAKSAAAPGDLLLGQPGLVASAPSQTSVKVNGSFVSVPFSQALNPPANKAFSVEAWVNPEWDASETDVFRCVVASRKDTGPGAAKVGYILYAGPSLDPQVTDGKMHWQAWVGDGVNAWVMKVGPQVVVRQTTYLLLTYDGLTQPTTLTLDAIPVDTDMTTAMIQAARSVRTPATYSPVLDDTIQLFIGMGTPETWPPHFAFFGRLQEIAFYDRALSPADVFDHLTKAKST